MASTRLEDRIQRAAEAALAEQSCVSAVDVLLRLGWLAPTHLDLWRQGRVECLERVVQAGLGKQSTAMRTLQAWAGRRGLKPSETEYLARTRDRRRLRFSVSGKPDIERAYRTRWVAPELSTRKAESLRKAAEKAPDLVVVAALNEWTCARCSVTGEALLHMQDEGPLCLRCARLDHLVFLPAGDARRTRRAHRASELTAVVVRFSRSRRRYERQGLLVEAGALDGAAADAPGPRAGVGAPRYGRRSDADARGGALATPTVAKTSP